MREWADEIEAVGAWIGGPFARSEPRRRAIGYIRGLLSATERKNGWQLAEHLGDPTPDGVQHLLARADGDADAVRDDLLGYVGRGARPRRRRAAGGRDRLPEEGITVGGSGPPVPRHRGRIENGQVGVFLGYAAAKGRALIDRALYRPKEWAADTVRRKRAGVPAAVAFATKIALARQMIERSGPGCRPGG